MKEKMIVVPDDVRKVLHQCTMSEDSVILPQEDLGPLYAKVKRVLEAADGHWDTKTQCFLFETPALDRLKAAMTTGKMVNRRQSFQEFFTPMVIADKMAELVVESYRFNPIEDDTFYVLEPSAGKGALVSAMLERYEFVHPVSICAAEVQKTNLDAIPGDPRVRKVCTDFLQAALPASPGFGGYHAVLMNPPFGRKTWVEHVTRALAFLRKGGVLVAVVPRTASLSDLGLQSGCKALLTPIKCQFDGTAVKVSILTVNVPPTRVKTVFFNILDGKIDAFRAVKAQSKIPSLKVCMRQLRQAMDESNKAMAELEAMLKDI